MLTDSHILFWEIGNCILKSKIVNIFACRLKGIELNYRFLL